MYIHIIILISAIMISSFAASQYKNTHDILINTAPSISKMGAVLTFAFLIFFGGNRTAYIDTTSYAGMFRTINPGISNAINYCLEEENGLFYSIISIIKTFIGDNTRMFFFVLLIIQLYGYIRLFRYYSTNYSFTAFLFITSMEYTMTLNALRQTMAITMVLMACKQFFERKTIKFILVVLIASMAHLSVIIWIPIYFFVHEKPWTKKMIIFFIGIAGAVLFIDTFTNILDNMTTGTEYEGYVEMFENDDGVNIIRVLFFATTPILAFMKRRELEDAPDYINVCINLSAVTTSIYLIGAFTSGILVGRLPTYISSFNWVLLPYILDDKKNSINGILKFCIYFFYFAYFIYNLNVTMYGSYESSYLGIYAYN